MTVVSLSVTRHPVSIGRRPVAGLVVAVLIGLLLPAAAAQERSGRLSAARVADGVQHEVWRAGGSAALIQVARLTPGGRVRLAVAQPAGGLTSRETTSSLCGRTRGCVAAVNGDFFAKDGPIGGVVSAGALVRSPVRGHAQLSLSPLRATSSALGPEGWSAVVTPDGGSALTLTGVNVALGDDGLVLYTRAFGATSPPCSCVELLLHGAGAGVTRLDAPQTLAVRGRGQGATALDLRTVVLAGQGAAAARLRAVTASTVTVSVTVAQPTTENLGAHPVVLRDGRPAPYDESDPMLSERHPRTAVGWNGTGQVWLVAADGRQPGGPGLTGAEAVSFLRQLGARDAVLLDGGGSTTFTLGRRVANRPSDGQERPVGNAVLVMVDPPALAAQRLTAARTTALAQATMKRPAALRKPTAVAKAKPVVRRTAEKPASSAGSKKPARVKVTAPGRLAAPPAPAVTALPVTTPVQLPAEETPGPLAPAAATALLVLLAVAWAQVALGRRAGSAVSPAQGLGARGLPFG